jgi:hypothetical protein
MRWHAPHTSFHWLVHEPQPQQQWAPGGAAGDAASLGAAVAEAHGAAASAEQALDPWLVHTPALRGAVAGAPVDAGGQVARHLGARRGCCGSAPLLFAVPQELPHAAPNARARGRAR